MKTKLQLLLLLIIFSVTLVTNAAYRYIDPKTAEPAKPKIHLICDTKGESVGESKKESIERVIEIIVKDLEGDDDVCMATTYGLPSFDREIFGNSGYKFENHQEEEEGSRCESTEHFIHLKDLDYVGDDPNARSGKIKWLYEHKINRHTGVIVSNAYHSNPYWGFDLRVSGRCKDFVSKNTNNSSATVNKTPKKSRGYSSGTGFYVNKKGLMITNNHVVKSCNKIKVDGSSAVVKSFDTTNDLALLKVDSSSSSVPDFRAGRDIRLGDGVTVAGYPLRSVLGSGLNVVTGTVASLSGVKNNSSRLQITAPINSGNSGGPLFDSSGRVVGIIVSKINNTKARKVLGEEIQGANFAIKGSVVRSFLDMNDVDYEVSTSNKNMSTADIAENAKEYTALIKCWK
jgi:hypothetical protein